MQTYKLRMHPGLRKAGNRYALINNRERRDLDIFFHRREGVSVTALMFTMRKFKFRYCMS